MPRWEFKLILVLHFAGIHGKIIYKRPGEDASLPCATAPSTDPTCSTVSWHYNRDPSLPEVEIGVNSSSPRASRLSLDPYCSLVISKVTAEDVGLYTCLHAVNTNVFLNVLTVSPSPPDADPKRDGEVTLKCILWRHSNLGNCRQNSLRWFDETGAELREGDGDSLLKQRKCVCALTVRRQSGPNRRYTCKFNGMKDNDVIEADYTPDFTDSTDWSPLSHVMLALRIAALILMIAITVLVIRKTCYTKRLDNDNKDNNDVQYENVEARPATLL